MNEYSRHQKFEICEREIQNDVYITDWKISETAIIVDFIINNYVQNRKEHTSY